MKLLIDWPNSPTLTVAILIALLVAIGVRPTFNETEAQMQAAGGYGIVDYELAYTSEKAGTILNAWGESGRTAARDSLIIDFPFMSAYAVLIGGLTLVFARRVSGRMQTIGLILALGQLGAAVFDGIENMMLLLILNTPPDAIAVGPPLIAGVSASIKFGLIVAGLVYWLIAGVILLIGRFKKKELNA